MAGGQDVHAAVLHEVVVCGLKWGVGIVGDFMLYISKHFAPFEDYN